MFTSLQRLVRRLRNGASAYPASLPGGFPYAVPLTRFADAVNRVRAVILMAVLLAGPVLIPVFIVKTYAGISTAKALAARGVPGTATTTQARKTSGGRHQHSSETYVITYAYDVRGSDGRKVSYTGSYRNRVRRGSSVDVGRAIAILYDPEHPEVSALTLGHAQRQATVARWSLIVLPGLWCILFAGVYFGGRERKPMEAQPAAAA